MWCSSASPSRKAAAADTLDFKLTLTGQPVAHEPNYQAEFRVDRSPSPAEFGNSGFVISDLTVLSNDLPYVSQLTPIAFGIGGFGLEDRNLSSPPGANAVYNIGLAGQYFTGGYADPTFLLGTYTGFGYLGNSYNDTLVISEAPTTPAPEPASVLLTLTGVSLATIVFYRRGALNFPNS